MPIDALPPNPQPTDSRATFTSKMFAWIAALTNWTTQANVLEANVNAREASATAKAAAADSSAQQAQGAAAAAGAVRWIAGTNYAQGAAVYSPTDMQTYRCKTAGVSNTDPANDAANWTRVVFAAGAIAGGAQNGGSITLTKASPASQVLNVATHGKSVTLPDATTISSPLNNLYTLNNPTAFFVSIKNSAGTVLGFVEPFKTVNVSLVDNTTAAGVWALDNAAICGISAELLSTVIPGPNGRHIAAHTLDATRTMVVFGGDTGVFAVVWDEAAGAFGTVTAVRANVSGGRWCTATTPNGVLFAYQSGFLYALVLTAVGTTITVNGVSNSVESDIADISPLVSIGNGAFALACYYTGPWIGAYAITVNGTAVTFSNRVNQLIQGGNIPSVFPTGVAGGFVVIGVDQNANGVNFRACSLAANVLSVGANTASGQSVNGNEFRVVPVNGRWLVFYREGVTTSYYLSATLFSANGTVGSKSDLNQFSAMSNAPYPNAMEACAVGGNKVLLAMPNSGDNKLYFDLFTDTNGVLSKGTVQSIGEMRAIQPALIGVSGNTARIFYNSNSPGYGSGVINVDCSSSAPALSNNPDGGALFYNVSSGIYTNVALTFVSLGTNCYYGNRLNGKTLLGVGGAWRIPLSEGRAVTATLRKCVNVNTGKVMDIANGFFTSPQSNDSGANQSTLAMAQETADRVWGIEFSAMGGVISIQRYQAAA